LVGATGGTVVSSGVAFAAACPSGTGVTVVVNSSVSCDGNGGGPASSNFAAGGHSLKYASRQPGFVCRVDGAPASDPCVNASPSDAYWALFWSDGKSGTWSYSSVGVGSLNVPTGGWVAFAFQSSNSRTYPGVRPYTAPSAPAPAPKPKAATPTSAAPSPSASARAAASAKSKGSSASPAPSASASATAAAGAREEALQRAAQRSDDSPTSTLWVGILLALLLLIGMGVTIWQRRARRS
ncbi:hypothetical protein, partial [Aeromicrobium sp.]|uniref:hypothetical protein n=1 Tax=Aeromicrobium sp. TaxID=1871063 RepID=UPI003C3C1A7C